MRASTSNFSAAADEGLGRGLRRRERLLGRLRVAGSASATGREQEEGAEETGEMGKAVLDFMVLTSPSPSPAAAPAAAAAASASVAGGSA